MLTVRSSFTTGVETNAGDAVIPPDVLSSPFASYINLISWYDEDAVHILAIKTNGLCQCEL